MTQVRLENVTKVFPIEGRGLDGVKDLGRALSGKELPGDKAGIKALDNVNLLIRHGETMSLIGPTACGKTTLLKVIAGLIEPDEGAVYFDGQDVTKAPDYVMAKRLARVFQDPLMGTAAGMTIEENLYLAELRGQRRRLWWGVTKA